MKKQLTLFALLMLLLVSCSDNENNIEENQTGVILSQIGSEADNPDIVNSIVTVEQLEMILPSLLYIEASKENEYQDYIDNNPDLFSSPATTEEVQAMIIEVNSVLSATGRRWMDRNLGATQVATSASDELAFGDLYQWGRSSDGHQLRTASLIQGPVAAGTEGANRIKSTSGDWLDISDDNRWKEGEKTAHDPCPDGYRIPTRSEILDEIGSWSSQGGGAYLSPLKLPSSGYANSSSGLVSQSLHLYWTSSAISSNGRAYVFNVSSVGIGQSSRSIGASVRCIKNE